MLQVILTVSVGVDRTLSPSTTRGDTWSKHTDIRRKHGGDRWETQAAYIGDMTTVTRVHVVVAGTVQGVGFRWWTARKADGLELAGYARNLFDGTVEVEAEGPSAAVDALVEMLRTGPPAATVTDVSTRPVVPHGDTERFDILR
jgi:acylphosphatase